jgi:hypothetical protein
VKVKLSSNFFVSENYPSHGKILFAQAFRLTFMITASKQKMYAEKVNQTLSHVVHQKFKPHHSFIACTTRNFLLSLIIFDPSLPIIMPMILGLRERRRERKKVNPYLDVVRLKGKLTHSTLP